MEYQIYPNADDLAAAATEFVVKRIRDAVAHRRVARVVFATGNSQLDFLERLLQADVPWDKIIAFHLDEYVNLSETHPASFRLYLREKLFSKVSMREVHLLNGNAEDPYAECERYTALLNAGPIDLACVGIGENGHLAFNDPPADFETNEWVHVVELDDACRTQQVGEGYFASVADVPPRALSMTVPAIMKAASISCVVPDQRKAEAVAAAILGPLTPDCPATILREHKNCRIFLDAESGGRLTAKPR